MRPSLYASARRCASQGARAGTLQSTTQRRKLGRGRGGTSAMNRAAARCWQACSPDKRPILSHRQMTHRQAPKTKQTCLGFGQGLPESRTLRTLSSSPTGGQVAVFRLFLVLVNQGLHPPCPLRFAQRIDGAPSGARPVVPDALAWQGHGREGAGGGARAVAGARGGGRRDDGERHGRGLVLLSRTRFVRVLSAYGSRLRGP